MFSKSRPETELSNAEQAMMRRNRSLLDEEIEESEKRLKAMARQRLGNASLLVGVGGARQASSSKARPSLVSGGGSVTGGGAAPTSGNTVANK